MTQNGNETLLIEDGTEVIEIGKYCQREDISIVVLPTSVKRIDDYAFAGCTNMTRINIPNDVTEIGENAFAGCTSLEEIYIPDNVRQIGTEAFANCSHLKRISLPRLFNDLTPTLFLNCLELEEIKIGDFYETDGKYIWSKEGRKLIIALSAPCDTQLAIPEGITGISPNALALNPHISSLLLPSSLEKIDGKSIAGMKWLCKIDTKEGAKYESKDGLLTRDNTIILCPPAFESKVIKIDEKIRRIGEGAFRSCDKIASVLLPENIENFVIDDFAFAECHNLTEVRGSAKSIGEKAFANCNKIAVIPIGENTETIGEDAFEGCEALTSVSMPTGLRHISQGAFADCSHLSEIDFHDDIEEIGNQAFIGCSKLETADLPLNLKRVGYGAFAWSGLRAIALPCEIEDVADFAFGMCKNLEAATLPNKLFSKAERIFAGSNKLQLMGSNDKRR